MDNRLANTQESRKGGSVPNPLLPRHVVTVISWKSMIVKGSDQTPQSENLSHITKKLLKPTKVVAGGERDLE